MARDRGRTLSKRESTYQRTNIFSTPGLSVRKEYTHTCKACAKEFKDGNHNTKRCKECRK